MFGHDNQAKNDDGQDDTVITPMPDAVLNDNPMSHDAPVPDDPPTDEPNVPIMNDDADDNDSPIPGDAADDDDLLDIKRQALQQLQPLVDHLEQTPEEKFKTTMMMIQAADDKTLIQTAYDAAKQISDEKTRAQALLDVINEINYFTHPQDE